MRIGNGLLWLRNTTAICLMVAVFAATSLVASASPDKNASMGELVVSGISVDGNQPAVLLNGENAISGRTFFSTGTIATSDTNSAIVKLGKLGMVSISPNSNVSLSFNESAINAEIKSGKITVMNSEGIAVNVVNAEGNSLGEINNSGTYDANASAAKQDDDQGDVSNRDQAALIALFAGVVAVAVILMLTQNDNNDQVGVAVSPVR